MNKVGRNDPCPCGSGKKYKKCHLNKNTPPIFDEISLEAMVGLMEKKKKAEVEKLLLAQKGILIRFLPPVLFKNLKIWAIGNRIYYNKVLSQTFHEFIIDR